MWLGQRNGCHHEMQLLQLAVTNLQPLSHSHGGNRKKQKTTKILWYADKASWCSLVRWMNLILMIIDRGSVATRNQQNSPSHSNPLHCFVLVVKGCLVSLVSWETGAVVWHWKMFLLICPKDKRNTSTDRSSFAKTSWFVPVSAAVLKHWQQNELLLWWTVPGVWKKRWTAGV